jgi:ribosome-binding factor A
VRHRLRRSGDAAPPFIDPEFAEGLSAGRGSRRDRAGKFEHRTLALCRQVQRALALALAGECGDDVLREAYVIAVEPAPNASRLAVRLAVSSDVSIVDFLSRIERVTPRLRALVAQAITRKRVPELVFIPAAPEENQP